MATLNVTFNDPTDQFGENAALIAADLQAAWTNWLAALDLTLNSSIELVVTPSAQGGFLARGLPAGFEEAGPGGLVRSNVADELLTGQDPNESAADATLEVSVASLAALRFTGDPIGTVAAINVFMHELGHIIAFNETPEPGTRTLFENLVEGDTTKVFTGNFARAANGGQGVPVTAGGNIAESAFPAALMSETVTGTTPIAILDVERAMLADMGFGVTGIDDLIENNTNNPPLAGNDNFTTTALQSVRITTLQLLFNDSDPNGDPLTVTGVSL